LKRKVIRAELKVSLYLVKIKGFCCIRNSGSALHLMATFALLAYCRRRNLCCRRNHHTEK